MIDVQPQNKKCILAISFLNYRTAIGGMSKYMLAHEKMYTDAGYTYMSIYFVKKIVKKEYPIFHFYGLIIDGKEIGIYTLDDILYFFKELEKNGYTINDVHIHNILYMNADHMIRLTNALPITPFKLILHDFHTICINFNLLKNGNTYCGGNAISERKCADCRYYKCGKIHVKNIRMIFQNIRDRLTVVAPSDIARQIWLEAYPEFKNNIITVTEQLWDGEYFGNRDSIDMSRPVVIGYLGNKSPHKGWNQWEKFVEKANRSHNRYKCVVFNSKRDFNNAHMEHHLVKFKQEDLNAMITALRDEKIDCAILWSIWPETYSYTLFEACSANAFILTNSNSGNIAYTVQKKGNGLVLKSEDELYHFAENPDELIIKINEARKHGTPGPNTLIDNTNFVNLTDRKQRYIVNYKEPDNLHKLGQKFLLKMILFFSGILKIRF
ncbi:hypothetical protein H5983_02860 [Faecalitalea cylindroides]|uniref:hypothetical protein n=1 Tax=Faecalitalea cylindroides TaxID=39483 RepID=UPI0019564576|nr:hypothetical protein [Faecalitalea cylindroides]MBM6810021.1 hypothetical protein [Faecalitalea cylindroides]